MKFCPWCRCRRLRRCRREGISEYLLSLTGIYPHKCGNCNRRTLRMIWRKSITSASLAVATVSVLVLIYTFELRQTPVAPFVAKHESKPLQVKSGTVLANRDIVALAERKVSPKTIMRLIERHPCRFNASPVELMRMKDGGVDAEVLDAVVANVGDCEPGPIPSSSVAQSADNREEPDAAAATDKSEEVE